jgi:hypothetical protein
MQRLTRLPAIAALSLIFTYLFFIEYLPTFRRVNIPYDLESFHYPLADYAFQALRHGRFPEWDPTIYCGSSFVGNIQAALFYPPTWVAFAANLGRERLSYRSLEYVVLAHVWLAFLLCYVWLRHKRLAPLSSVLGAGVFAYSGYLMLQLQHLGLVGGYTWVPLGLWGIDQAVEERRWRPLWKLVAASALCFLAGRPPTWFVFAVIMTSYAAFGPWRWRAVSGTILALGASLLITMVQLLPAWEATSFKIYEARYGSGIRDPEFYVSYLVPNYYDFGLNVDVNTNRGREYLYLGAPAFLGLILLVRRRRFRDLSPLLAVAAVSLVAVTNPFGLVWQIVRHSSLLSQVCRDWYFLAGLTLAAAPLAAVGLDDYLKRTSRPMPRWLAPLTVALLAAWAGRELLVWFPDGTRFPAGWRSALEPAITLVLFSAGVFLWPSQTGKTRVWLTIALLLAVGADYKVFGTSKRFNATRTSVLGHWGSVPFPELEDRTYGQLRANPDYRIVLDRTAPFPQDLRHCALTTPQGFDPLLTSQYKTAIEDIAHFRDLEIDIDPGNEAALSLLGVRYFVTTKAGPLYPHLSTSPQFRLLQPSQKSHKVFEYVRPRRPYGWVPEDHAHSVERREWTPEVRKFVARSDTGGRFVLVEQSFPGWRATVDGVRVPVERWKEAFQAIWVPAGEHQVEFRFRSKGLRLGAFVSLASILALALLLREK